MSYEQVNKKQRKIVSLSNLPILLYPRFALCSRGLFIYFFTLIAVCFFLYFFFQACQILLTYIRKTQPEQQKHREGRNRPERDRGHSDCLHSHFKSINTC